MRQPAHFKTFALLLLLLPLAAAPQHRRHWSARATVLCATSPAMRRPARRLRINAHGPVSVQAGTASSISYTVRVSVRARTEAEARRVMQRYNVRVNSAGRMGGPDRARRSGDFHRHGQSAPRWITWWSPPPMARWMPMASKARSKSIPAPANSPSTASAAIANSITGGGDIKVGAVGGALHCSTGAGKIQRRHGARSRRNWKPSAAISSPTDVGGAVRAETGGGGIRHRKSWRRRDRRHRRRPDRRR